MKAQIGMDGMKWEKEVERGEKVSKFERYLP